MKIAFYVPPTPDENTTPVLGPLYLLAVLEKEGFEGRLFDGRLDGKAFGKMVAYRPDVMGVSAVTAAYPGGLRAAARLREACPNAKVVFGGAHPSALPGAVASEPAVDCAMIGESERTFPDLCRRARAGDVSSASLREVGNLAFRSGGEIALTKQAEHLSGDELDSLPLPAFHLMDLEAYFANTQTHGLFRRGRRILPLMSSRGCPYNCSFCCRMMGRGIRSRSVESVMAEVRFLVGTYGMDEVYFEDDNFTVQRDRAMEILDRMAGFSPPIHLKFANGLRADQVNAELLAAMKRARVYALSFGIESGCPSTLAGMNKALNLDLARENVLLAKSMGFLVGSNCIIGYPGETEQDVEESLSFFFGLPLDSMAIVNLVPFPGTEARRLCEAKGYLTEEARDWGNYFFSLNNPIPLIETPHLPKEKLIGLIHKAYRRMYLSPRWLRSSLRHLTFRQIVAGAAIMMGLKNRRRCSAVETP